MKTIQVSTPNRLAGLHQVAWLVVATFNSQLNWSWSYRSHWDLIWGWQNVWSLVA